MARIRTIKPEFPQSETIGRLSRDARLLFIQLWTIVDDEGRARAASRMLASLLYPYDNDAPTLIEAWLSELEGEGCIRRYEVDRKTYLDIPHWGDHQKIDHKSISKLPAYQSSRDPREASREVESVSESLAPDLVPVSGPVSKNPEPNGSEPNGSLLSSMGLTESQTERASRQKRKNKTTLSQNFAPDRDFARRLGWPASRIDEQIQAFCDSALAHARQYADWQAAWRNWCTSPYQKPVAELANGHAKPPSDEEKAKVEGMKKDWWNKHKTWPFGGSNPYAEN